MAKKPRFDAEMITPYAFITPAILVMLGGLLYPVVMAFYLSFYDWEIGRKLSEAPYLGIDNFVRMVQDPQVWEVLWVTLRFGFWTISIEMILGIGLALLLEKPIRGASVFRTIFILPL
ncbi:MAG: sugar ABC transporter permease, partial [Pseudomonadota bacterium]